jgi:hypothetical protein
MQRKLDRNALHFVEVDFVAPAVVELCGASRGMVRHGGRVFQRAAILKICGDPGCTERVISDGGLYANGRRAPTDHGVGIGLG